MGKILAICSDSKKTGKSVIAYMLANQITKSRKIKVLVCCLNLKYSSLYSLFKIEPFETGIEDLVNYGIYERLNEDILLSLIPSCGDIYFLGSYKSTNSYIIRNQEKYSALLDTLSHNFDLVIIDTVSGRENTLTKLALQKADLAIKLYCQDIENIREQYTNEFSENEDRVNILKKTIRLISKYRNIYPNATDLMKSLSDKNIFVHEYCETLQEMKNRDRLHLYLQRDSAANRSVNKLSDYALQLLEIQPQKTEENTHQVFSIKGLERFFRRVGIEGNK